MCKYYCRLLTTHPISNLFPSTTLFRSRSGSGARISIETLRMLGRSMARNMPTSAAGLVCKRQDCKHRMRKRRDWKQRNRSEEHTSELQSLRQLVCRLLLEKKK